MTSDASPEIRALTRRTILRSGLMVGLGAATIVAASRTLPASAQTDASVPQSADNPAANAPEQWGWNFCHQCLGMWSRQRR